MVIAVPLHSRLWARFAGCQRAAEPALEYRDPFRPPQRAADGGGPLDPGRRRRVGRHGEKRRKIRDQGAQRRHRCELVILARELRPSARTWPVLRTAHQPRDHRIERDVTRRRQQMRLVHHYRPKAALEQMARPPEASVDGPGIAPMRFGKGRPQPVRVRRCDDQVDTGATQSSRVSQWWC